MITLSVAPLRGITNSTFRNVYASLFEGIDYALAPFVSATAGKKVNLSVLKDILPGKNELMPLIPQVIGANPADVKMMFNVIHQELGYDRININMGCPHRPIVSKGRGSGFLKKPDSIWKMLDTICDDAKFEITLKTRLGYDDPKQILGLIPKFNDYPISELILHTRTATQMYKGATYPEIFAQCMNISKIPLVYNGDIFCLDDYTKLQKMLPECDSWMIGRGLVSNPFLPSEIKSGKLVADGEKLATMEEFHSQLFAEYQNILFGPAHLLGKMKEYWCYMADNMPDGKKLLSNIRRTKTVESYNHTVYKYFHE
ncbi:MAG: tRNA-dihydrouridine synthase family protein [Kiritimatiellae bacterium]|jgi:tRNA-dihydrouridine synthase B|nr:tRNA-dihydrouridine synthase family protein [Kiritimatiellia bacterium]